MEKFIIPNIGIIDISLCFIITILCIQPTEQASKVASNHIFFQALKHHCRVITWMRLSRLNSSRAVQDSSPIGPKNNVHLVQSVLSRDL